MKRLLIVVLLFTVSCKYTVHEGMPIISEGQYGTILPGHPECVAEKLRADLIVNPDGSYLTQEQWDAMGWDFTVKPGYLQWTRHGKVAGYSSAEDSTAWNLRLCVNVR